MRLAWLFAGAMVVTGVLVGTGCGAEEPSRTEPVRATTQAIQNGSVDSTHSFALGVCINGTGAVNSGQCAGRCSGALILPNVVATARHCVDETPEKIDCTTNPSFGARKSNFRVTTNTTMAGAANGWYGVKSVAVPSDDHICGNDIALFVLSSSIPGSVATPIVPGVQYQMWDPDQYDSAFIGIGYGKTSPGADDSGTRRISKLISVLCVPGSATMDCPPQFNDKEFVGGDGTCSGDSGSSAFEWKLFGQGKFVSFGVLSRGGENADKTECQGSIYTRFDAHRQFVLDVVKTASNNWSLYPEPSWTAYKPPPTPKPKDAGAPVAKDAGTTTEAPKLGLGESCEKASQCESGKCSDPGDGALVCAQPCSEDDTTSCPDGYECRESLCLPPAAATAAPAAAPATVTTTGCAAGPASGPTGWGGLSLGLLLGLGAIARRRR